MSVESKLLLNGTPELCLVVSHCERAGTKGWARVKQALRCGLHWVQYAPAVRETGEMVAEATSLMRICRQVQAKFTVSGRLDIALATMADGVYLQGGDMPVALARRLLGPSAIIGVQVCEPRQCRDALQQGASYVAVDLIEMAVTASTAGDGGVGNYTAVSPLPVCGWNPGSLEAGRLALTAGSFNLALVEGSEKPAELCEAVNQYLALLREFSQPAPPWVHNKT